jgi:hypothetical protein
MRTCGVRMNPIERSQLRVHGGKIQVIVTGAFGEANKELDPLLQRLAKLTAKTNSAGRWDRCLPPKPVEAEKMLKRRYWECNLQYGIANAEMKVMRSHIVGKTPEEAMMLWPCSQ